MSSKPNRCHCGGLRHKHDIARIALLEAAATRVITPERSEWHPTDYVHVDKKAYDALAALLQEDKPHE
jgi:hypothetical protein